MVTLECPFVLKVVWIEYCYWETLSCMETVRK